MVHTSRQMVSLYIWMPNDLKDYYQNYVLTGNNVTVNLPVEVIGQAGEKAENTFVQIEFSNGYSSNLVFITIPNETAEKHAVDNNGTVLTAKLSHCTKSLTTFLMA